MRVQVHPADQGGCGLYRARWPAQAIIDQGGDVRFGANLAGVYVRDQEHHEHLIGVHVPDVDVIVLQRVLDVAVLRMIPKIQEQGVAVVVEIDDDFHALPATNPARAQTDPRTNPTYNRDILAKACRAADLVTVSTPALAKRYGSHGRVAIIPNYVRARWLDLDLTGHAEQVIGWTGVILTHVGDVDVAAAGIRDVLARQPVGGWGFRGIGSDRTADALGFDPMMRLAHFTSRPWQDLTTDAYPREIARLGIGIVPLALNQFNEGKSWLKGIEYAACGVPFVASPVAQYRALAKILEVRIATGRRSWADHLNALIASRSLRDDIAGTNRARMADYTIEGNTDRWIDAWETAWKTRRNRGPRPW